MRVNARKTIECFKQGKAGAGDSKRTIWTDGARVYSYRMLIGERMPDGSVWIVPYSEAPSNTTRSHVRALEQTFRG